MSKYKIKELWEQMYGKNNEVCDYSGRPMKKSACVNQNSKYCPTIDHIRPISEGGEDVIGNIVICHRDTNAEKANHFPHWKAGGSRFHAVRVKGSRTSYDIIKD